MRRRRVVVESRRAKAAEVGLGRLGGRKAGEAVVVGGAEIARGKDYRDHKI